MRNWSNIIKDLEIILASDVADSVKAFQIKVLFESNHITLADYREFYDKSTQEKPLKSLDHLKKVEQFIGEDMKKEAQQQRKKTNIIKYNPREEDSPKDRN